MSFIIGINGQGLMDIGMGEDFLNEVARKQKNCRRKIAYRRKYIEQYEYQGKEKHNEELPTARRKEPHQLVSTGNMRTPEIPGDKSINMKQ